MQALLQMLGKAKNCTRPRVHVRGGFEKSLMTVNRGLVVTRKHPRAASVIEV